MVASIIISTVFNHHSNITINNMKAGDAESSWHLHGGQRVHNWSSSLRKSVSLKVRILIWPVHGKGNGLHDIPQLQCRKNKPSSQPPGPLHKGYEMLNMYSSAWWFTILRRFTWRHFWTSVQLLRDISNATHCPDAQIFECMDTAPQKSPCAGPGFLPKKK